jgi:ABC-type cobalamin/Fe3+-siderophores transport system ATPase subunit
MPGQAARLADTVMMLDGGRIVAAGDKEEVLKRYETFFQ